MPFSLWFTIITVGASLASAQLKGTCPSDFQITSTHGALYSTSDGTQFPGPSDIGLQETEFQLTADGSLISATDGSRCDFIPWLKCGGDSDVGDRIQLGQRGGVSLIVYGGAPNSTFYACSAIGLGNYFIDQNVTFPSSAGSSDNTTTITEYYILPDYLTTSIPAEAKRNGSCVSVGLQASSCYPFTNATTSGTSPVGTYTPSANAAGTTRASRWIWVGLGAFIVSWNLF